MSFIITAKFLGQHFGSIPKLWDGREAILEMRNAKSTQWRQMEWMGFYFEFLCERILSDVMQIPGPQYGNVRFDGFLKIPWDFKAHAMNTSSHKIIVNDSEAVNAAIKDYGGVGLILAVGEVTYNDEKRTFQQWHDRLKGKQSKYVKERKKRGAWSRLRKVLVDLKQISFIKITSDTVARSGSFQAEFRNADGSLRREKLLIDLEKIEQDILHTLEF